jgi:hypothetical protein
MLMDQKAVIIKLSILFKAIYRFNTSPYQDPNDLFHRNRKTHPKIHMESQGMPNSQIWSPKFYNIVKENQSWKTHSS